LKPVYFEDLVEGYRSGTEHRQIYRSASAMMVAVSELQVHPVDPRDTSWELWDPRYLVYFWQSLGQGWRSREFELTGGDVVAVLAWAAAHTQDRESYTVHCIVESADGTGLVRLTGNDPTRSDLPIRAAPFR
jgi:hypothetical protein